MLQRSFYIIFIIIILFNITKISLIINDLTLKPPMSINNELRLGYLMKDNEIKGYSIVEYQNNTEKLAILRKNNDNTFQLEEYLYKSISDSPFISIPFDEKESEKTVIVSFDNNNERKRLLIGNNKKSESIIEYKYDCEIHNKFKYEFKFNDYSNNMIYNDLINDLKKKFNFN